MPTKIEKDAISGRETTGHEWDGIKELDTPLPRWWLTVLYATIVFAVVWCVLYPSVPFARSYFRGILGYSQRTELTQAMERAAAGQADMRGALQNASLQQILDNAELRSFAVAGGKAVFANNCAVCHAPGGAGRPGYPSLADDKWLWGGKLDEIAATVAHGIRAGDAKTRTSAMPRFGEDQILTQAQIADVAAFVRSLSDQHVARSPKGEAVYAEQCAACHGKAGEGSREFGAPALRDGLWLYGGTADAIARQINNPRHGVMPAWTGRLNPVDLKMVTIYVHQLGGGE